MYQIIKEGIAFHVNEKERAMKYASEGYEVLRVDKLRMNEKGEFEVDEPIVPEAGVGQSEELPSPDFHAIGG